MFSINLIFCSLVTFIVCVVYCQQQFPFLSAAGPPISRITSQQWKELNESVGGRLFLGAPLALPCYNNFNGVPNTPDPAHCKDVKDSRWNTDYLTDRMAGWVHVWFYFVFSNKIWKSDIHDRETGGHVSV